MGINMDRAASCVVVGASSPSSGCRYEHRLPHFFVRSPWCRRQENQNRRPVSREGFGLCSIGRFILYSTLRAGHHPIEARTCLEGQHDGHVLSPCTKWLQLLPLEFRSLSVPAMMIWTTVKVQSVARLLPTRATRSHSVTYPTLADLVRIYVFRSSHRVIRKTIHRLAYCSTDHTGARTLHRHGLGQRDQSG
jgi:hypothetical protein